MTGAVQLAMLGVVVLLVALVRYSIKTYRRERISIVGVVAFVLLGALLLGLAGVLAFAG